MDGSDIKLLLCLFNVAFLTAIFRRMLAAKKCWLLETSDTRLIRTSRRDICNFLLIDFLWHHRVIPMYLMDAFVREESTADYKIFVKIKIANSSSFSDICSILDRQFWT